MKNLIFLVLISFNSLLFAEQDEIGQIIKKDMKNLNEQVSTLDKYLSLLETGKTDGWTNEQLEHRDYLEKQRLKQVEYLKKEIAESEKLLQLQKGELERLQNQDVNLDFVLEDMANLKQMTVAEAITELDKIIQSSD